MRLEVEAVVRLADGDGPVVLAPHHHALDDGLPAVEVVLSTGLLRHGVDA